MARPNRWPCGRAPRPPDEQDVGPVGQHISGDKTVDASSGAFGQDAGVAEMLSQEQVRVEGIEVERRALGDEAVQGGAVLALGGRICCVPPQPPAPRHLRGWGFPVRYRSYDQPRFGRRAAGGHLEDGRSRIGVRLGGGRVPVLLHQGHDALQRQRDGGLLQFRQRVQRVRQVFLQRRRRILASARPVSVAVTNTMRRSSRPRSRRISPLSSRRSRIPTTVLGLTWDLAADRRGRQRPVGDDGRQARAAAR